jgi:hypothetical protein
MAAELLADRIAEEEAQKKAIQKSIERNRRRKAEKEKSGQRDKQLEKAIIKKMTTTKWFKELVKIYLESAARHGMQDQTTIHYENVIRAFKTHPNQGIRALAKKQWNEVTSKLTKKVK